jgi:hypothetical protein
VDRALLTEAYVQSKWWATSTFSFSAGLHAQYYTIGEAVAVEPRLGASWIVAPEVTVNIGYGHHSQVQNIYVYNVRTYDSVGVASAANRSLDMTRSRHAVAGVDWYINERTRLRAEAYAQWLTNAPVEERPTSYSALNAGAEFFPSRTGGLVSTGTGRNIGLELTLERYLHDGLYYMVTGSLFDSRYEGSDGIERNTAFNSLYVANVIAGKEFAIGERDVLSVNLRLNTSGGKYLTPVDLEASQAAGTTVYDQSQAYSVRASPYFRMDLRLAYRMEFASSSLEFAIDLMNVTNHENIYLQTYNPNTRSVTTQYQQGFIPVPMVRWTL